jgi:hypothetical protein
MMAASEQDPPAQAPLVDYLNAVVEGTGAEIVEREDDHTLYLRWKARSDEERARRRHEERAEADRRHREGDAHMSRILGAAADNGAGVCRWCGLTLGTDDEGRRTHPIVRECSGPTPTACGLCDAPHRWDATVGRWTHVCVDHKTRAAPEAPNVERVRTPSPGKGMTRLGDVRAAEPDAPGDTGFFGMRRPGGST